MVAVLVDMKMVSAGGARNLNDRCAIATLALKPVTQNTDKDHGNQDQQQNNRHQEIELDRRRLLGVPGHNGGVGSHAVCPL